MPEPSINRHGASLPLSHAAKGQAGFESQGQHGGDQSTDCRFNTITKFEFSENVF